VRAAQGRPGVGLPVALSAAVHVTAAVALFISRSGEPPVVRPPVYKVNIVAAPPGPRAAGVVTPPPRTPAPEPKVATPPPPRPEVVPKTMPPPPTPRARPPARTPPAPATPTPPPPRPVPQPKEAPRAGGGPTGGRGTDVATVRTQGIDFPYPGYLNNIVRQIALNFAPPNPNSPLVAEVSFLIRRDGSVTNLRFIRRSGSYVFDLEAQGAVEAAGSQRAFGPLPEGFQDDVLPVVFSFDPRFLR